MSLRAQIFAALSLIFMLVLVVVLGASVRSTRHYLQEQLAEHAQESATALSVTLAQALVKEDLVAAEAHVLSVFDRGYFQQVSVLDANKKVLVQKSLPERVEGVPGWVVTMLPLTANPGEAFVSSGWRQLGKVIVVSQPTFAYQHLWTSLYQLVLWLFVMYAMALLAAWWLLRLIMRPLHSIEATAMQIQSKQFEQISLLPKAPELRKVVDAMNQMSSKVGHMLQTETQKAVQLHKLAYEDELTGFVNRRGYEGRLVDLLQGDNPFEVGAVLALELDDMRLLNRAKGFASGEGVLRACADVLRDIWPANETVLLARSNEFSFAAVVLDADAQHMKGVAQRVLQLLEQRFQTLGVSESIRFHVGLSFFDKTDTKSSVFSRADLAVESARQSRQNGLFVLDGAPDKHWALGSFAWRQLIQDALHEGRWQLMQQPVQSLQTGVAEPTAPWQMECMARLVDTAGELVAASVFVPMAARHRLMPSVDKAVLTLALRTIKEGHAPGVELAVNLSAQGAADAELIQWLDKELDAVPAGALAVEMSEYAVLKGRATAQALRTVLRKHGQRFGIDNFGMHPDGLSALQLLNANYIKLSGAFTKDLEQSDSVSHTLASIVALAHSLDCLVVGQHVETQEQVNRLQTLGVDAGQGYWFGKAV